MTFPPTSALPILMASKGWNWRNAEHAGIPSRPDFWIGEDGAGNRWLVKMKGGFCAWRDRAFSVIAQAIGISCQSATFLLLEPGSPPLEGLGRPIRGGGRHVNLEQSAIWLLPEHVKGRCSEGCPLPLLNQCMRGADPVEALSQAPVGYAVDIVRGEILGYLCNQFEPADKLYTPDHFFVQIDNERMFVKEPANLLACPWLQRRHEWSLEGLNEARMVCASVTKLPDEIIFDAASRPQNYKIIRPWDVGKLVRGLRARASQYLSRVDRLIEQCAAGNAPPTSLFR